MLFDIVVDDKLSDDLAAGGEKSYTTVAFALA